MQLISDEVRRHWIGAAGGVPELVPNVPLAVMVMEAFELSHFIEHYWEPDADEQGLPGLRHAVSAVFPEHIAEEIAELALLVSSLQAEYNALISPPLIAPVQRGEFLLNELQQALSFLFDDSTLDHNDQALKRLKESHNQRQSHDALAMSLEGFAYFANTHRDKLVRLPGFEEQMLDEALDVAQRLRAQSGMKMIDRVQSKRRDIRKQRASVTRLLHERMGAARRVIRYAFRSRPDIVQRATSQYRRERRAKQRKAVQEEPE